MSQAGVGGERARRRPRGAGAQGGVLFEGRTVDVSSLQGTPKPLEGKSPTGTASRRNERRTTGEGARMRNPPGELSRTGQGRPRRDAC